MNEQRAYSWLSVRSVDEEKREIIGVATTPQVARDGDVLETKGIQFKLPIPCLWRHRDPFGNVIDASVDDKTGITVRIRVAPKGVSATIDEQWGLVKAGVVRGLSIGWRTLEENFDKTINGFRISKSEWLELSCVPVPADAGATILSVRSADETILAALGDKGRSAVRSNRITPGVSGQNLKGEKMKSFEEQIRDLENERKPIGERMESAWTLKTTEGREFTHEEGEKYDEDFSEMEKIDVSIKRLRAQIQNVSGARPVSREAGNGEPDTSRHSRIEVKKVELPKGNLMARAAIATIQSYIQRVPAADLAARHYKDTPEVAMYLRASVAAADTTTSGWASQLVPAAQQMQEDFLELLRPASLVGRIPGLRRVPFNIAVPLAIDGGTYGWVGESAPKPVTRNTFGSATLRWSKIAAIIVFTKELAKFSSPAAEGIIRDNMIKGIAQYIDTQFTDPAVAAVANVSPASITNGITPLTPQGTTANDLLYDISRMIALFIADNQDPSSAVIIMPASVAANASLMLNSLGQPQFGNLSIAGGSIAGIPVVVSQSVGTRIIMLNASDILFADDGQVSIDVSEQASVEMNTVPITGESSPITGAELHSLWQRNEIGLRAERFITWARARTSAVQFIATPAYVGTHT